MPESELVTEEKILGCVRECASSLGGRNIVLIRSLKNSGAFIVYDAEGDRGIVMGYHSLESTPSNPGPVLMTEDDLKRKGYTTRGHYRSNQDQIEGFAFMRSAIVRLREIRKLRGVA